jgi:DNA-binding Xre family transcriptional regulator
VPKGKEFDSFLEDWPMSAIAISPRSGIVIDAAKLDYELGRRGITARELAARTGIPEPTISRARHGRPVSESTLRRLSTGLLEIPLWLGTDLLIAEPERKIPTASTSAGTSKEVGSASSATSARV